MPNKQNYSNFDQIVRTSEQLLQSYYLDRKSEACGQKPDSGSVFHSNPFRFSEHVP